MIVKQFKLSLPEKDKLIRIKSRTGIQNWNVICRWALCWSLNEESIPGGVDPASDSNVEMTETNSALAVADNDQSGELHNAATLNGLGNTVKSNYLLDKLGSSFFLGLSIVTSVVIISHFYVSSFR